MVSLFDNYDAVVLDVSLCFSSLSDSDALFEALKIFEENEGVLFQSPAFLVEFDALINVVNSELVETANAYMERINMFNIESFPQKELGGGCDCSSLVVRLISEDIDVAIVTTDKLLIERLILNNIQVSIINPTNAENPLIIPSDFEDYKIKSDVLATEQPIPIIHTHIIEGDSLYCGEDGSTVTLTKVYNNGGKDAIIYECDRAGVVAKIFNEGHLTDTKLQNIKDFMNFNKNLTWLAYPLDILYSTALTSDASKSNCPVGYLMVKIDDVTAIGIEELFVGDLDVVFYENYKDIKPSYVAEICIAVVRQIVYLHMNGILFGDFNGGNFALKNDRSTDYVVFFDVDGYGYKKNLVVSGAAEWENPRKYNRDDKREFLRAEYDNLCIVIFRWLMLGMPPFVNAEYYDWHNETEERKARWALIPVPLQVLFNKVFKDGKLVTPTELLFTLEKAHTTMKSQPSYSKHFTKFLEEGDDPPTPSGDLEDIFSNWSGTSSSFDQPPPKKSMPTALKIAIAVIIVIVIFFIVFALMSGGSTPEGASSVGGIFIIEEFSQI